MTEPAAPVVDAPSTARRLARGVCRLLADMGMGSLTEFTLANGRRLDVVGLGGDGRLLGVEIKSCVADWRADRKWREYLDYCDGFCFAVDADFPRQLVPEDCGLIVADGFAAALLRPPPPLVLHPSRRKAVMLRFALTASQRLKALTDPPA